MVDPIDILPPVFIAPLTPSPPAIVSAPVELEVDAVELDTLTEPLKTLFPLKVCPPPIVARVKRVGVELVK